MAYIFDKKNVKPVLNELGINIKKDVIFQILIMDKKQEKIFFK